MSKTIYTYLKNDHKKVANLFEQIIIAHSQEEREKLFLMLEMELELHSDPEAKTFYKALEKNKKGEEDSEHGHEEHKKFKALIKVIKNISSSEPNRWLVTLGQLKNLVEHHVEEEEKVMFKDGKTIINDKKAVELAEEMETLKDKMRNKETFKERFEQASDT